VDSIEKLAESCLPKAGSMERVLNEPNMQRIREKIVEVFGPVLAARDAALAHVRDCDARIRHQREEITSLHRDVQQLIEGRNRENSWGNEARAQVALLREALERIKSAEFKGWSPWATDPGDGNADGYVRRLKRYASEALAATPTQVLEIGSSELLKRFSQRKT
jgi:hypothetical protein